MREEVFRRNLAPRGPRTIRDSREGEISHTPVSLLPLPSTLRNPSPTDRHFVMAVSSQLAPLRRDEEEAPKFHLPLLLCPPNSFVRSSSRSKPGLSRHKHPTPKTRENYLERRRGTERREEGNESLTLPPPSPLLFSSLER